MDGSDSIAATVDAARAGDDASGAHDASTAGGDADTAVDAADEYTPDEVDPVDIDETEYAPEGDPEAAPGERAADANDHEQDNAVETTTVPEDDEAELAESEQHRHD